jgi:hypothetical protein
MKQFKYSLAKRGKIICDNCKKKTAVAYIETETGNIVSGAMRCDREEKCGYHKKPETNDFVFVTKELVKEKKTDYIHLSVFEKHFFNPCICNLITFLETIFDAEQIKKARYDYFISSKNNNTIFWQIDQLERIRTGKIMEYNLKTGRRVKDENGKAKINWVHKQPYTLKQCLFGLHLTKEDKVKTIAIVESEKTAIIMSIFVPDFIWLATGSLSGFKIEYLSIIKLRKIIAFPDKGCFQDWFNKALEMNNFGYNITVSDLVENTDCEKGLDIADLYLNEVL